MPDKKALAEAAAHDIVCAKHFLYMAYRRAYSIASSNYDKDKLQDIYECLLENTSEMIDILAQIAKEDENK